MHDLVYTKDVQNVKRKRDHADKILLVKKEKLPVAKRVCVCVGVGMRIYVYD